MPQDGPTRRARHPLSPRGGSPGLETDYYATESDSRPIHGNGILGHSESEAGGHLAHRPAALYAGPSERGNPAAAQYIRQASYQSFALVGQPGALPGAPAAGQYPGAAPPNGGAAGHTPAALADGRAVASQQGAPHNVVVPSYPGPISAQPPPALATITTADAMATEGRLLRVGAWEPCVSSRCSRAISSIHALHALHALQAASSKTPRCTSSTCGSSPPRRRPRRRWRRSATCSSSASTSGARSARGACTASVLCPHGHLSSS